MSSIWHSFYRLLAVLFALAAVSAYLLLLVPFTVGFNIREGGVVRDVSSVPAQQLPLEIKSLLGSEREYEMLMIENPIKNDRWVIFLTRRMEIATGSAVEVKDKLLDWRVDWHDYPFATQRFDRLLVGEVDEMGYPEDMVLGLLDTEDGKLIFGVSGLNFLLGGLVLVWLVSWAFRSRGLWRAPAAVCLYSFELSFFFLESLLHPIVGVPQSSMKIYLVVAAGVISILSGVISIVLWRAESKPESKQKIEKLYKAFIEGIKSTLR